MSEDNHPIYTLPWFFKWGLRYEAFQSFIFTVLVITGAFLIDSCTKYLYFGFVINSLFMVYWVFELLPAYKKMLSVHHEGLPKIKKRD